MFITTLVPTTSPWPDFIYLSFGKIIWSVNRQAVIIVMSIFIYNWQKAIISVYLYSDNLILLNFRYFVADMILRLTIYRLYRFFT